MLNYNGIITDNSTLSLANRGLLYGDALFETIRVVKNKINFSEAHYFRLMASMRILRMRIPQNFTLEFFESQIHAVVPNQDAYRVRMTVFRNEGGRYTPDTNTVSYIVSSEPIDYIDFQINSGPSEVDLFKDFHIANHLLSTLKTTNRLINIVGSVYAKENDLQNCLLLNESKNVVETLNGNLFMLTGNTLRTPPLSEGCLNGVLRKQVINLVQKWDNFLVEEQPISPFELQKADELFYTNAIQGIQSITKYRKKEYGNTTASKLVDALNALV